MPETASPAIRIDIVSDVVCPWCIIGYKQLEHALKENGAAAAVHWHPFELNPDMAEDGENLREHLAAKYGTKPEDSRRARARLTELGAALGFAFNYADDMRMHNTFRAHQLLHWAETQWRQHALKMALFDAFFTHRRNVNDMDVLADVAASIGLRRASALAALADGRFAGAVREAEAFWTSRGITGVPTMVFDQRYPLVGAQGVETYSRMLNKLTEEPVA